MPLDGTPNADATAKLLIAAKQALIDDGWVIARRRNTDGRRCALGALDKAIGVEWEDGGINPCHPAIERLDRTIPPEFRSRLNQHDSATFRIAFYNNAQEDIKPILKWFDRAIAWQPA